MEASLVFSDLSDHKQPISNNIFENFNEKIIEKLETKNEVCQKELAIKQINILKYLNQTMTLSEKVTEFSKTTEELSQQIQTYEEQVSNVQKEKETTVSKKDETIKVYAEEKIELEEKNAEILHNKFLLERKLRSEIQAKEQGKNV